MGRYLDMLRNSENAGGGNQKNLKNPPAPSFLGFLGTPPAPFEKNKRHQVGTGNSALPSRDEQAIRSWLALIGETDPAIIADVLGKCQRDPDALRYFLSRSKEVAQ